AELQVLLPVRRLAVRARRRRAREEQLLADVLAGEALLQPAELVGRDAGGDARGGGEEAVLLAGHEAGRQLLRGDHRAAQVEHARIRAAAREETERLQLAARARFVAQLA